MTDSLMGSAEEQPQDNQAGAGDAGDPNQKNGWFYAENLPGQGERPEFLQQKFKSVEEQAKSYTELEKRFGGFKGAPETYEVKLPEELADKIAINPDDNLYKTFVEVAKKSNMSNETFNEIIHSYAKQNLEVSQTNIQEELKKIGDNAGQRLGNLKRWAENSLDENQMKVFHSLNTNADAVLLFEKFKSMMSESVAPTGGTVSKGGITHPEIMEMMKDERYASGDANYRREVQEKIRQFAGE